MGFICGVESKMFRNIFLTLAFSSLIIFSNFYFATCQVSREDGKQLQEKEDRMKSVTTILVENLLKSTIKCSKDKNLKFLASQCLHERDFIRRQLFNQSEWAYQRKLTFN